MQYLYNYPQFIDDLGQISLELKNELIKFLGKQSVLNLVLQQQQQLLQKMNVLNNYLISNETQSTIQESKLDSVVVISQDEEKINDKNFIRKECLQRYRAKKKMWMNRTLYECRKQIADRRLRFNGQFLNCEEEKKIIKIHKILGNHYIKIKNNIVVIIFYKILTITQKQMAQKKQNIQTKNKYWRELISYCLAKQKKEYKINKYCLNYSDYIYIIFILKALKYTDLLDEYHPTQYLQFIPHEYSYKNQYDMNFIPFYLSKSHYLGNLQFYSYHYFYINNLLYYFELLFLQQFQSQSKY